MEYILIYLVAAFVIGVFFARLADSTDPIDVFAYAVIAPIVLATVALSLADGAIKWLYRSQTEQ